jgi:hypothetical protein
LKADVQPLLARSCSLASSCHLGSTHPPNLGPQLNYPDGGKVPVEAADLQAIMTAVLKPSAQVPARQYVAPGKPEDSYLMNKVEGTHACSGFTCVGPVGCGVRMPEASPALPTSEVELLRDWIKKGATM